MCVPGCQEAVARQLSRRGFFRGAGAAAAGVALGPALSSGALAQSATFSKVVDLTHPLGEDFPTYFGVKQLEIEVLNTYEKDKFNIKKWHVVEHTGTHLDTPFHFSADGLSAEKIDVANLVVPLAVIDVKEKAAGDPDYQVSVDDLKAWETANGALPNNCCVAMNSGWAAHLMTDKFRNAGADKVMHFPGFSKAAAEMLMDERKVAGIAVDTLSLDPGNSPDFAVHYLWLPSGRWGLECVANLDSVPAKGATLVVGGPTIIGASGGPSRIIALV